MAVISPEIKRLLHRLAQNREAARKSRLRKKVLLSPEIGMQAYVQQLQSSRMKLTQLEKELLRARQQGIFISNSGDQSQSNGGNGDGELRIIVDGVVSHHDDIYRIKGDAAKADVFHILSGMWKTPAERCFLWLGGFHSSELL